MSNFGFSDLLSDGDLAARNNIGVIGDKVVVLSTWNTSSVQNAPQSPDETNNRNSSLRAKNEALKNEGKQEITPTDNFTINPKSLSDVSQDNNANLEYNSLYQIKDSDYFLGRGRPNAIKSPPTREPTLAPSRDRVKRFLQERSFLVFEYETEGRLRQFSILPFFENILISEDQRANFAVYDLIGRAGNMYSYLGAKSRQFKLTFRLNVMHIHNILSTEGYAIEDFSQKIVDPTNKEEIRKRFFTPPKNDNTKNKNLSRDAANVYHSLKLNSDVVFSDDNRFNGYEKTFNTILWWINLVRTSVTNNSQNTIYGPPIIRINHGLLYNNIPCVCTNFSIREVDNSVYDVVNNTSLLFEVSMNLEETRSSNSEYVAGDELKGDNITGWDGLKQYNTIDPYNGVWNYKGTDTQPPVSTNPNEYIDSIFEGLR